MQLTLRLLLLLLLCCPATALALEIDIFGPGQTRLNMALAKPMGQTAEAALPRETEVLQETLLDNLLFLPFLNVIPSESVLGGPLAGYKSPDVDFKRFQLADADLLLTTGWTGYASPSAAPDPASAAAYGEVELRVYEAFTGELLVGSAYSGVTEENVTKVADRFSAAFMKALTGRDEFFRATMAFVKKDAEGNKNVWIVKPTGRDLRRLTNYKGFALSPSWSKDGRYIVFSHIAERFHSLGIWDGETGQARTVRYPGNTIIGPTFTAENKIAVSMATGGNPDIYQVDHRFQKEKLLVENWAIDVSPSFDATGTMMAFVSSRLGNPHIFVKNLQTEEVRRVTFEGTYNTSPSISPDGELVVFSRLTDAGHRIFLHDLKTGMERQLTFGPGDDEEPAFAPDGYFLAFTSSRGGKRSIHLTTRHGDTPKLIPTGEGDAGFPDWGLTDQ